ncbi:adrenocorticotropic hormone receptor [Lingula anatina]|uniref:Adrenocorticotropic hormone receptor n=1 Tax=Lingula anatina TaxID=7574 RepID=A0A1S3HA43_LINAN|nr:adrenocorticotropic hormone receptor [Lingula anatina]XP_013382878.1 adrenocorticotropic hormone receptor [Lingula anatina]XP_013382879.1 adrenocorticotropic hormone receptor [Lingula anatina]XP_013382880.1 adrenocorticotropic hormone receptor [Lingula anatina]XP_013382881.1 adrenocorticotropic hormone receptor [Lingula anatina]XP_013382882.1 adrenocorticotropic hormone receptor [Lingula anatina]XP_013382883.1 adrenocorticotropic hormone receptor [Lingula anatina]XP_013382884.1 adrenocort|eukprot:XP_013382877.1 adrenocorticotropic hormone receptor [Lingula anatina]
MSRYISSVAMNTTENITTVLLAPVATEAMNNSGANSTACSMVNLHVYIPIIFCVVGIVMNFVSLLAIIQMMRDTFYYLLANLCVADILILISAAVAYEYHDYRYYCGVTPDELTEVMCMMNLLYYLFTTMIYSSALTTVSLVAYQSITIFCPYTYRHFTKRSRTIFIIVLIWIVSFLLGFGPYMHLARISMDENKDMSYRGICQLYVNDPSYNLSENIVLGVTIIVSALTVLVLYAKIFLLVRQMSHREMPTQTQHKVKVAGTMVLIYGVLVLFWIPHALILTISSISSESPDPELKERLMIGQYTTMTLLVCNALMDPIIYGVRLPGIRKGYLKLCRALHITNDYKATKCFCSDRYERDRNTHLDMTETTMAVPMHMTHLPSQGKVVYTQVNGLSQETPNGTSEELTKEDSI